MNSSRKTAIAVGVLFLVATIAGVSQFPFLKSINAPDYLSSIAAHQNHIVTAVLLDLIMIGAVLAIPVVLFPILEKHSERIARGYVVARIFEATPLVIGVFSMMALLTLSQDFVAAGATDAVHYQTLGVLLLETCDWTLLIGGQVILSLTALILNYSMYRTKLIPRLLSGWGLVGVPLMLASGVIVMFGVVGPSSTPQVLLMLPLALQEMVFAVWLIVKGFNQAAIASE